MAEIDQFKQYIYLGYTNRKIAEYLGCSERTVKSRRKEYNLRNKDVQSAVHDAELDEMVKAAVGKNPSYGEKMVAGLLASKNVHVQRDRIRQSIRRVDPDGVDTRKRVALHRRQYSVPGPNSLWHIDGNHKLIRDVPVSTTNCLQRWRMKTFWMLQMKLTLLPSIMCSCQSSITTWIFFNRVIFITN
ncbi:uncharacterized protein [Apostichopus japonicus]|uniref:uncharacterized protein isoform X4 n=1 Tax=Stichopus japonicus TaxID=307972 RepID=UPI003AB1C91C